MLRLEKLNDTKMTRAIFIFLNIVAYPLKIFQKVRK